MSIADTTPPAQIQLRPHQLPVFMDRSNGILVLHWARQIGKSFVLAAWSVDRLLAKLNTNPTWLITVLSNSRDNGAEFVRKCAEVCDALGVVQQSIDESPDLNYANMRMEVRITMPRVDRDHVGRIKVLAANPRTARGFSGDLILDEFAFHEDSQAIWDAAQPILDSNPEYLCRIASTGNGKFNTFYRIVESGLYPVNKVSRTDAWKAGLPVYDSVTRKPITPDEARKKALDKKAYDQNYELGWADENMALLTHELITAAERSPITVDENAWTQESLERMAHAEGDLYAGNDIGRSRDLSVLAVLERQGNIKRVVGMLRMAGLRLPAQQTQCDLVCELPRFRRYCGDMTGLGLGLVEYLQDRHDGQRIVGINFSETEPVSNRLLREGRRNTTARVTELMATDLLAEFEDRTIEIPCDMELREDLRKPERVTSPGGRVSIAASRDDAGHADHFWALALANRACRERESDYTMHLIGLSA